MSTGFGRTDEGAKQGPQDVSLGVRAHLALWTTRPALKRGRALRLCVLNKILRKLAHDHAYVDDLRQVAPSETVRGARRSSRSVR